MTESALRPTTKNARHQRIIDLVTHHEVRSQADLAALLAESGVHVTQATLSRDLVELDALKVRTPAGALVYAVPAEGGDRRPSLPSESAASAARLEGKRTGGGHGRAGDHGGVSGVRLD